MIKAIVSDFSRVILFTHPQHDGKSHKSLYEQISLQPNYNVFDYFRLNTDLLAFYKSLKDRYNQAVHIFTTDTIPHDAQFEPHLKFVVSGIYSAKDIGLKKDSPESYQTVLQEIGVQPHEAVYTDDKLEHVQAAQQAGLHAFHYISNEDLALKINEVIGS